MFQMNYCEFNRNNYDYDRIYRPDGSGDYLLLLWKTPMKCYLNGQLVISQENACLLYTPGVCQNYQAIRKFCNSYMHFSTDLAFEEKYNIPANQLLYPDNFQYLDSLMQEIQQEYLSKNPYYEYRLQNLTEEVFLQLSRALGHTHKQTPEYSSLHESMQKLRLQMLRTCEEDWTIEQLCRESNMSKTQFYHWLGCQK